MCLAEIHTVQLIEHKPVHVMPLPSAFNINSYRKRHDVNRLVLNELHRVGFSQSDAVSKMQTSATSSGLGCLHSHEFALFTSGLNAGRPVRTPRMTTTHNPNTTMQTAW